jgi:hypothetical protein
MKSRWTEHKGKRVFLADYSNFGSDSAGLQKECDEIMETFQNEPANSVLSLSNVEGTAASLSNVQVLMNILPKSNKFVRRRCVIGATGMRWQFIATFNKLTGKAPLRSFHTLQEALDWIVQE